MALLSVVRKDIDQTIQAGKDPQAVETLFPNGLE
jgi:hypothetical protein